MPKKRSQNIHFQKFQDYKTADSFGAIFRELRENAKLTTAELSELTKINRQYLERLESEEFGRLPPPVYVRGFIASAGKFLGKESIPTLLRLYASGANQKFESETLADQKSATKKRFMLGPKHIAFISGALFLLAVASFLVARFTPFLFEPEVEMGSPKTENTVTNFSNFSVNGRARFSSVLTLNGDLLYIGKKGFFSQEIELNEGVNRIAVEARNIFGRKIEVVRRVVYIKNSPNYSN